MRQVSVFSLCISPRLPPPRSPTSPGWSWRQPQTRREHAVAPIAPGAPAWEREASALPSLCPSSSSTTTTSTPVRLQLNPDARKYLGCMAKVKTYGSDENSSVTVSLVSSPETHRRRGRPPRPASGTPCVGGRHTRALMSRRRIHADCLGAGGGMGQVTEGPLPTPSEPCFCLSKKLKILDHSSDSDTNRLCDGGQVTMPL